MIEKTYSFIRDGKENDVYTFTNKNGVTMQMLTYGARIISLSVPDRNGKFIDVIVGPATPEEYYDQKDYFGATVGRYCNRIENGRFTLNGKEYQLEINQGKHSLHGGATANFDRAIWQAEIRGNSLEFTHFSPDGAGGYPGNMQVKAIYTLTDDNAVEVEFIATTDKDTLCNLTQHAFFNIGNASTILEQELMINADKITPCDLELMTHGEYLDVKGTPYSFLPAKKIGKDIFSDEKIIARCKGYDVNYCLNRKTESELEHCAYVYDEGSGRKLDVYTTLPGMQIYTGNATGGFKGKRGYVNHCSICLETQYYPNSPNCANYPSAVLKAKDTYSHKTVYKFSVVKD